MDQTIEQTESQCAGGKPSMALMSYDVVQSVGKEHAIQGFEQAPRCYSCGNAYQV